MTDCNHHPHRACHPHSFSHIVPLTSPGSPNKWLTLYTRGKFPRSSSSSSDSKVLTRDLRYVSSSFDGIRWMLTNIACPWDVLPHCGVSRPSSVAGSWSSWTISALNMKQYMTGLPPNPSGNSSCKSYRNSTKPVSCTVICETQTSWFPSRAERISSLLTLIGRG